MGSFSPILAGLDLIASGPWAARLSTETNLESPETHNFPRNRPNPSSISFLRIMSSGLKRSCSFTKGSRSLPQGSEDPALAFFTMLCMVLKTL